MTFSIRWTTEGAVISGGGPWGPTLADGLPVALSSSFPPPSALAVLDRLVMDDLAAVSGPDVLVPFNTVHGLEAFERASLGVPAIDNDVHVELRSTGYPRVGGGFDIRASLSRDDGTALPDSSRVGAWVSVGDRGFVLPKGTFALLQRLDEGAGESLEDQHRFIAESTRLAHACGAVLDGFLANQEYLTPAAVGVEVHAKSPDHLVLRPTAEGIDEEFPDFENSGGRVRTTYTKRDGRRRRRLLLSGEQKEAATAVGSVAEIRGADVPRFIENPEAFLPDAIDLTRFSPRVRGLMPRRYRSQPYLDVRASQGARDWFTVTPRIEMLPDPGFDWEATGPQQTEPIEPVDGAARHADAEQTGTGPDIQHSDYAALCRRVIETGEPDVQFDGVWLHIEPARAQRFLAALEELDRSDAGELRLHRAEVAYVLDVISNVEELAFDLDAGERALVDPPEYALPESLRAELYPHQRFGYRWLRYLHEEGYGGLLADDMGLGKTVQVAALIAHLFDTEQLGPSLLVVPNSLVPNWRAELARFCPQISAIYEHHGPGRVRDPAYLRGWDIVITTYGTLRRDQLMLGEVDWQLIACDEAQNVKNPTAQVTSAVKGMKAQIRLALTGTPVENGLSELWCIVDYVQPGKLGSWSRFRSEFERPLVAGAERLQRDTARQLQLELDPHYVRRKKADVLLDLPEKNEQRTEVPLGDIQAGQYSSIVRQLRDGKLIALQALQLLIQACSHPGLLDDSLADAGAVEVCPKLQKTIQTLESIRARGERAVIFTRFRRMQAILQEVLARQFSIFAPIINGEDSGRARQNRVDAFNAVPSFGALILSPEAAGVGLNITGANHVIHYTRLWNPAKENQATDRVHRLGQNRPVTVHYPIVVGEGFRSIEEHMDELLAEKSRLAENVLWPRESLSVVADLERQLRSDG